MNANKIVMLDVNDILPHPNNPRKDLGDLVELSSSIMTRGILQNLTVVPADRDLWDSLKDDGDDSMDNYFGKYTVIIGHRRLAAARLAGLAEVPCVIDGSMDDMEQIATMLLENIQRSDLTYLEQADGFQMMLDLGETVNGIVEKTGFSKSTVYSRIDMLKHDRAKLTDAIDRGATLQDILELNKVKDQKLRDEVIGSLGTYSFDWKLKDAVSKENRAENLVKAIALLDTIATRTESSDGMHYVASYDGSKPFSPPDDIGEVDYFFMVNTGAYGYLRILRSISEDEHIEAQAETEQREDLDVRRNQLTDIGRRAYELRKDYIRDFATAKTNLPVIVDWASDILLETDKWLRLNDELLRDMLDIPLGEEPDDEESLFTLSREVYDGQPEKRLLIAAYCYYGDKESYSGDYSCHYVRDEKLVNLYSFLESTGYLMSDEEHSLVDGTLEFFVIAEEAVR